MFFESEVTPNRFKFRDKGTNFQTISDRGFWCLILNKTSIIQEIDEIRQILL